MPSAAATAVLETIDVGSGERTESRVLDVDLSNTLRRAEELFGRPVQLHDGSQLFIQASTVETASEGTRITVYGPGVVAIEGIKFIVVKVHHIRMLKDF